MERNHCALRTRLPVPRCAGRGVELLLLPSSLVVTLSHTHLSWPAFGLLALAITAVAILAWQRRGKRAELAQRYAQERKRARQLDTIIQVSRQVTAILELDDLFQRSVRLIRESFGYYHVGIFTADRERETITFQASASAGDQDVVFDVVWGQGLLGWVAAHEQAVLVNDVQNEKRYLPVEALAETRSELCVPLMLEQEILGILDIQSDQINAFGLDDMFILETIGAQITLGIKDARLYEAEQQQAWFSTALLQVADAAGQVSDMEAVLETIARLTPMLVGVDRCAILLWEQDAESFVTARTYGFAPDLRDALVAMQFPPGSMPALDLVRWEKKPLLVQTTGKGMLIDPEFAQTFDIQQLALLPLLAQGELVGAMMVDYAGQSHPFSEQMVDMLSGIAKQAAMVIQIARLIRSQQEETYVSMALLQVAESVSRSTDLDEILGSVARITPILVGVEWCAIFLRDPITSSFVPAQQYGLPKEAHPAFWQLRLHEEDAFVREMMAAGPFVARSQLAESFPIVADRPGTFLLAVPLTSKGEVLGGMLVDHVRPVGHSAQRWMTILTGIANQAAIAVENDRLLREAAEQERMKQELDVARRIQASFLPESCPSIPGWELAAVWRSAREVGGDFYDFVPLPPDLGADGTRKIRSGVVIADVADKGVPAALFMALCRTLVRTMAMDGRAPSAAVGRANDLILADARSGLFVTLFYAILRADSADIGYVNAGHMPGLLVRASDGSVEELLTGGMALGVLPGFEFEQRTASLHPGDTLVLYTDGVSEASDAERQMFGKERLIQLARSHRSESAWELAHTIDDTIAAFVGNAAQFDDFTLVVAKRT